MKSLVSTLHEVASGILADAQKAYPHLGREFARDKCRLASLLATRGIGVFTLDLPALESSLIRGLEVGRLAVNGTPVSTCVSRRIQVPRLFRGLWLRLFASDGSLLQDPDIDALLILRQLLVIGKKLELPCHPSRQTKAIKEFIDVEKGLPVPTLSWELDEPFDRADVMRVAFSNASGLHDDSDSSSPTLFDNDRKGMRGEDSDLLERLDTICRDVSTGFGLFDPVAYELLRFDNGLPGAARNGPGAVSDRTGNEEKFSFPYWPDKLQTVFPHDFFAQLGGRVERVDFRNMEHPSRLLLVPKTAKAPRLIASEPSYHQWCQQVVLAFLVDGLRTMGLNRFIDFSSQESSHPLVTIGSQTGDLCTVDLSSASDRLSCYAIERAFKSNLSLLNAFHACRTRVVGPSRGADIEPMLLRKFATMGSALTFPVQSIFFFCCVMASLPGRPRLRDMTKRYSGQVRVYGDDIIIPKTGYARLVRLLTLLGLKVNEEKSFSTGRFRESCGYDAFGGYDVTPVKPRSLDATTPVGRQSLIDASNNLFLKGFWNAAQVIDSKLPQSTLRRLPVRGVGRAHNVRGLHEPTNGAPHIISFCGDDESRLRRRYNSHLHRYEVLGTTFSTRTETTYVEGRDYTFQSLHSLDRQHGSPYRVPVLAVSKDMSASTLGRVVKAITRERSSWEVSSQTV